MANQKAIYNPGELSKVREKLGVVDDKEAKRLQQILGGEVGRERSNAAAAEAKPQAKKNAGGMRKQGGGGDTKPKRLVEIAVEENSSKGKKSVYASVSASGPATYRERVRMDKLAGESDFGIKSSMQVFVSRLSLFRIPPDLVSYTFVTERLNEYLEKIQTLVNTTRILFPRNKTERSGRLIKKSRFAFAVLDTIRQWKVETVISEIGKAQSHPRSVYIKDLALALREIYKPIYILTDLETDIHIAEAYKIYYHMLYEESASEAEKLQEKINIALFQLRYVRKNLHYCLYPLLLKLLSNEYIPYDSFFYLKYDVFQEFLGVTENDKIKIPDNFNSSGGGAEEAKEDDAEAEAGTDELSEEEKKEAEAKKNNEKRALERGIKTLELLFPKAGWNRLGDFPDLYPYFRSLLDLFKDSELLAPEDPCSQVLVLSLIIQELLYGFRSISFMTKEGETGAPQESLADIINNWNITIAAGFDRQYLPRISECVKAAENSSLGKTSQYAIKVANDLHWIRRSYFLPYYQFSSFTPPSFQKKDIAPLFPNVRRLLKELTNLAIAIEKANKQGGYAEKAPVSGIENPWANYVFEIPNPLSRRLNALLAKEKRHNVSLIIFTLSVTSVLDYLLNNEESWAYKTNQKKLFRSADEDGKRPILVADTKIDADALFKESLNRFRASDSSATGVPR